MAERRFSLYCQVISSTPAGMIETTRDNPDAVVTVHLVKEGQEVQVRNAMGDLETFVEVIPVNSVTTTEGNPQRRGTPKEITRVPQSALQPIPSAAAPDQRYVDVLLPHGLRARVFTDSAQPRIISVGQAPQPR